MPSSKRRKRYLPARWKANPALGAFVATCDSYNYRTDCDWLDYNRVLDHVDGPALTRVLALYHAHHARREDLLDCRPRLPPRDDE